MPGLNFTVESAEAVPFAAAPTIGFGLRVAAPDERREIQSIALQCQIMIEPSRRHYNAAERESVRDLFGDADRWSQTLRPLLWTHASVTVPSFCGATDYELTVPCTFDFNIGATKYFHAIEDGELPLCFQFSGTVFYTGG